MASDSRPAGGARRILFVTDSLVAGGIESQLVDLVTRLDRDRYEPHVLYFYSDEPLHGPHFLPHLQQAGIPTYGLDLGMGATDKLEATRQIVAHVRRLRPAIIQAENYHANLLTRAARPFLPPTQVIGTLRVVYTPHQLRLERLERGLCDVMVASATHLKRQLVEVAGFPSERVVVIPNSVDVERFAKGNGAELRQRLAPGARRVLVSMGRISEQKRMHLIGEGLGRLKRSGYPLNDVRVFIIGPSQDAAQQKLLDDVIAREGLQETLIQLPPTSVPEDFFAASDATLLYTLIEGLAIVSLESLSAGKPVLTSEEANAAEVITDGVTGWIAPTHDIEAFAERLRQALDTTDEQLRVMGEACQAEARRYTMDELVRRYEALYDAMLTAPAAQRAEAMALATR